MSLLESHRTARPASCNFGTAKVWIDLDNTPHVPFFRPIIRELRTRNIAVVVTARDAFQVCELASKFGLDYRTIGRHGGKSAWLKLWGLGWRAAQFAPFLLREKPTLALSHGARSQMLAANLARIPTVMIDDYEHSRHLPLATPKWAIFPEVLAKKVRYCPSARLRTYPGMKEDVYASDFLPDSELGAKLGLRPDQIVVTVRPPATVAHYHNPESEGLLAHLMNRVRSTTDVVVVLLPRNKQQERELRAQFPEWFLSGRVMVPNSVIDGLQLVWLSDLVVSGGGTMNREAAALGVPVYSIFRGRIGAVDQWLREEGRLVLVECKADVDQLIRLERRNRSPVHREASGALPVLVQRIEEILSLESAS